MSSIDQLHLDPDRIDRPGVVFVTMNWKWLENKSFKSQPIYSYTFLYMQTIIQQIHYKTLWFMEGHLAWFFHCYQNLNYSWFIKVAQNHDIKWNAYPRRLHNLDHLFVSQNMPAWPLWKISWQNTRDGVRWSSNAVVTTRRFFWWHFTLVPAFPPQKPTAHWAFK